MMTVKETVDRVREIFTTHDERVAERAALLAKHTKAAAARRAEIARAQAAVDAIEKPRRDLERLQVEAAAAATREQNELGALEIWLREHWPRELERFDAMHMRLFQRLRNAEGPRATFEFNQLADTSRLTNLEELERWQAIGPLLTRISCEIRDTLWGLSSQDLRARLATLRAELEAALEGTGLEAELG